MTLSSNSSSGRSRSTSSRSSQEKVINNMSHLEGCRVTILGSTYAKEKGLAGKAGTIAIAGGIVFAVEVEGRLQYLSKEEIEIID